MRLLRSLSLISMLLIFLETETVKIPIRKKRESVLRKRHNRALKAKRRMPAITSQISNDVRPSQISDEDPPLVSTDGIRFEAETDWITDGYKLSLSMDQTKTVTELDGSKLPNAKEVAALDLSQGGKITEFKNLDQLSKLQILILSNNQLTTIDGDQFPVSLEKLTLENNQITKIKNLKRLRRLHHLNLFHNKLPSIDGDQLPKHLSYLQLQKNQITEIKNLDQLINLQELNLKDNPLTSIGTQVLFSCEDRTIVVSINHQNREQLFPRCSFLDKI